MKTILRFILIFSFFGMFLLCSQGAEASTIVAGDIETDTTWTKENSPFILQSSVVVIPGITLEIEPGVVVKFDSDFSNSSLYILGSLVALGEENEKIYFTSNYDDSVGGSTDDFCYEEYDDEGNVIGEVCEDYSEPMASDWGSIYFTNASNSQIRHAVISYADDTLNFFNSDAVLENVSIQYADTGITAFENSSLEINNIKVSDIFQDALVLFNNAEASVINFEITDIDRYPISLFNSSQLNIEELNLKNITSESSDAIIVFNSSKLDIKNSSFENCGSTCITVFDGDAYASEPSSVDIRDSVFDGGAGDMMQVFGSSEVVTKITNSIIKNFAGYGINNFSENSTTDAKGNFWGDASGPLHPTENPLGLGVPVSDNVLFAPWLLSENPTTPRDPVIIIPGITGSYLFKDYGNEGEIWPNVDALLTSLSDEFLNDLMMNNDGSENPVFPIVVGDIIRKEAGFDVFEELIHDLRDAGYVEEEDLFVFPYDWRISSGYNAILLSEKVESILQETNSEKVDIISHSMGGVLTKTYLTEEGLDKVDQLVFLGTPHLGAPKAYKALMYGDSMGYEKFNVPVLNQQRLKHIAQNMPAVYELLPSQKYVSDNGGYVINQENENNPMTLNYAQTKSKMVADGRNVLMFPFAENLHDDIDDLDLAGVEVHNFVGCGGKTLGEITFKRKLSWVGSSFQMADDFDIHYVNGDSTVPQVSAGAVESGVTYFAKGISHGSMPSANGVKEAVVAILKGEEIPPHESILSTDENCNISGKNVSVHSPVELHIYDEEGNHVGPLENGDIENKIPGVEYDVIGGEKFAFLPDGENYRIVTKATNTGGYDLVVKSQNENDEIISTDEWKLIPLETTEAEGEMMVGPDHPREEYELAMDDDGDGVVDETIEPTPEPGPFYYLEVLRSFIKSLDLKPKVEKTLLEKIDKLEKKLKKKKDTKFVEKLEKVIQNVQDNKGKFKKFSQLEKDLLIVTITSLLDSLK